MSFHVHPFAPVYDADSLVLILGTFPSPRSRAEGFYYGNPHNAFWRTLSRALDVPEPDASAEARRGFLLENRIALWDVLRSCEITGARDGSIAAPVANELRRVIEDSAVTAVFTTGKKATELYNTLSAASTGVAAVYLPSTSPANRARWDTPEYWDAWAAVKRAVMQNQEYGK
jgi:hypoxanthine-DNA glycosylase